MVMMVERLAKLIAFVGRQEGFSLARPTGHLTYFAGIPPNYSECGVPCLPVRAQFRTVLPRRTFMRYTRHGW